jgi:hypothetical protein
VCFVIRKHTMLKRTRTDPTASTRLQKLPRTDTNIENKSGQVNAILQHVSGTTIPTLIDIDTFPTKKGPFMQEGVTYTVLSYKLIPNPIDLPNGDPMYGSYYLVFHSTAQTTNEYMSFESSNDIIRMRDKLYNEEDLDDTKEADEMKDIHGEYIDEGPDSPADSSDDCFIDDCFIDDE